MDEEREVDLPLDKTYILPSFTFVNHNGVTLAVKRIRKRYMTL